MLCSYQCCCCYCCWRRVVVAAVAVVAVGDGIAVAGEANAVVEEEGYTGFAAAAVAVVDAVAEASL